mmetsp:Transcript_37406/g.85730  ORF Transcript_37406/g.85730 Transcript_37406/m.85730 type:complete len:151 (-) Transcript_37406:409-861(-)
MQDDEGRVADVKRQLVAMCGDGWEEEEWTPYIQQVVRFLIEEKEVSQKKVFAAVKGLIDYGVTTEAELKNVADTKLEFRSTLHAKGIPEAICDSLFVKYCAPGLNGSASEAQLLAVDLDWTLRHRKKNGKSHSSVAQLCSGRKTDLRWWI